VDEIHDMSIVSAIVFYSSDIVVRRRTLIAHVADAHDMSMIVDALQSERLLQLCRWININRDETHP
jgi:alpha-L-fucosidase